MDSQIDQATQMSIRRVLLPKLFFELFNICAAVSSCTSALQNSNFVYENNLHFSFVMGTKFQHFSSCLEIFFLRTFSVVFVLTFRGEQQLFFPNPSRLLLVLIHQPCSRRSDLSSERAWKRLRQKCRNVNQIWGTISPLFFTNACAQNRKHRQWNLQSLLT